MIYGKNSEKRNDTDTTAIQTQGQPRPLRITMFEATRSNLTHTPQDIFDVKRVSRRTKKERGMKFEDFQNYVAILDVDGNSWSERFGKLLCMNSIVLKVEPEFVDYYMPNTLQPWVHYIPINMNSSNLVPIVKWVLHPQNEDYVRKVINNANIWCSKQMKYTTIIEDLLDTLEFYVMQLNKHNPNWYEVWSNSTVILQEEEEGDTNTTTTRATTAATTKFNKIHNWRPLTAYQSFSNHHISQSEKMF